VDGSPALPRSPAIHRAPPTQMRERGAGLAPGNQPPALPPVSTGLPQARAKAGARQHGRKRLIRPDLCHDAGAWRASRARAWRGPARERGPPSGLGGVLLEYRRYRREAVARAHGSGHWMGFRRGSLAYRCARVAWQAVRARADGVGCRAYTPPQRGWNCCLHAQIAEEKAGGAKNSWSLLSKSKEANP